MPLRHHQTKTQRTDYHIQYVGKVPISKRCYLVRYHPNYFGKRSRLRRLSKQEIDQLNYFNRYSDACFQYQQSSNYPFISVCCILAIAIMFIFLFVIDFAGYKTLHHYFY